MSTHIPGPWRVIEQGAGQRYVIKANHASYVIAECGLIDGKSALATARVIAAAPDLLDALRALLPLAINESPGGCDGKSIGCPTCAAIKFARAAIAQATGEA